MQTRSSDGTNMLCAKPLAAQQTDGSCCNCTPLWSYFISGSFLPTHHHSAGSVPAYAFAHFKLAKEGVSPSASPDNLIILVLAKATIGITFESHLCPPNRFIYQFYHNPQLNLPSWEILHHSPALNFTIYWKWRHGNGRKSSKTVI